MAWAKSSEMLVKHHQELMFGLECERKQMFGFQVFFVNNNMFSGIYEEGVTLRLSPADRELIMQEHDEVVPFTPLGRPMKEYVLVPESLVYDKVFMNKWVKRSYEFVSAMPEKKKKVKK